MKQFEFSVASFDRIELREATSEARVALNALGAQGWHIVHVQVDSQHDRALLVFLERELTA